MKNVIRYEFCDGTVSEIEVSDDLYATHVQMVDEQRCNHWKNTRRHVLLSYLHECEIDIPTPDSDLLAIAIKNEDVEKLHIVLRLLPDRQRELIEKVFFEGMSLTAIAALENVSQAAISQRLATVIKKLKKLW